MTLATVARAGFFAFLVWAPIPLGSNRPIFWTINAAIVAILFAIQLVGSRKRRLPALAGWVLAWPLGATLLLSGWMAIQAAGFVPSGLHHPAWALPGLDAPGAISANPSASLSTLLQFLTVALTAVLAARIGLARDRSDAILRAVVVSAVVVAGWGLLALTLGWPQILFGDGPAFSDRLTSFFVNRNATAIFLGLGMTAITALMVTRLQTSRTGHDWPSVLVDFPARAGLHLLVLALLGMATLSTGSRAGAAASLIGVLSIFALSWRGGRGQRPVRLAALVVIALGAFLLLFGTSSTLLFERLADLDFSTEARWQFYRDTLGAIADRPLLGHGAGTFADIYPLYRSPEAPDGILLAAHNTYLQAAAELGLPALAFGAIVLAVILWRCLRAGRRPNEPRAAARAAVGAAVVVGVHSLFEFSLQIQGVALVFAAMVGAGLAATIVIDRKAGAELEALERAA